MRKVAAALAAFAAIFISLPVANAATPVIRVVYIPH